MSQNQRIAITTTQLTNSFETEEEGLTGKEGIERFFLPEGSCTWRSPLFGRGRCRRVDTSRERWPSKRGWGGTARCGWNRGRPLSWHTLETPCAGGRGSRGERTVGWRSANRGRSNRTSRCKAVPAAWLIRFHHCIELLRWLELYRGTWSRERNEPRCPPSLVFHLWVSSFDVYLEDDGIVTQSRRSDDIIVRRD